MFDRVRNTVGEGVRRIRKSPSPIKRKSKKLPVPPVTNKSPSKVSFSSFRDFGLLLTTYPATSGGKPETHSVVSEQLRAVVQSRKVHDARRELL